MEWMEYKKKNGNIFKLKKRELNKLFYLDGLAFLSRYPFTSYNRKISFKFLEKKKVPYLHNLQNLSILVFQPFQLQLEIHLIFLSSLSP